VSEENVGWKLGVELIYSLQTLHLVDQLRQYHAGTGTTLYRYNTTPAQVDIIQV